MPPVFDFVLELDRMVREWKKSGIKVALDVEGVLADITTPVVKMYNEMNGTGWSFDDIKDWGFKSINANVHEILSLFNVVWTQRYNEIKYWGDSPLINTLGRMLDLHIVTSRVGVDSQLKYFLKSNGLGDLPLVIHAPTSEKTDMEYQLYIDDSPILAAEVAKTDSRAILLVDRPWNRDVEQHKRILRVDSVNTAASELVGALRRANRKKLQI